MKKKRPTPPDVDQVREQPKTKKRKRLFKKGDFVKNVEDDSLIVLVTRDAETSVPSFHGTCVASTKNRVGEHERFWLLDRFELINVKIEVI